MSDAKIVVSSKGFTTVMNDIFKETGLSLKAVGLFCKMHSLPDSWDYTISGLGKICKDGKDAIRAGLRELEAAGYLVRSQSHDQEGKFGGSVYTLYAVPNQPLAGFPTTGNPTTGKPTTEKPLTENPTQLNINQENNKEEIPPIVPQGGRKRREVKQEPDWKPERFAGFWAFYPRGESKQAAISAWDKLRPSDELIDRMGIALKDQLARENWQRGIGIPYASTWLNQRRWEDEPRRNDGQRQTVGGATVLQEEEGVYYL